MQLSFDQLPLCNQNTMCADETNKQMFNIDKYANYDNINHY